MSFRPQPAIQQLCDPSRASLDSVIITGELSRRPSRPPDYDSENRALVSLSQILATTPEAVLNQVVEAAMELCRAHSAGVSLLDLDEQRQEVFRWKAVAGLFAPVVGGSIARNASPCDLVIDRNTVLLLRYPERHFEYPIRIDPPMVEALLIPFHHEGKPVGTIWVIAHDETRKFDAEDARVMEHLSLFASSAYQVLQQMEARKRAQTVLEESERRFRALVNASSEVLYRMNPDWSEMRTLSGHCFLAETEAPSREWPQKYIYPEDWAQVLAAINKAIQTRSVFQLEHRVRRANGAVGWALSRAVPLMNEKGEIVEWFGAATDISSRKIAEEALIRSEKLAVTAKMAATLAHQVNNPLTGAMNATHLASQSQGLAPETKAYLRLVDQELRRAAHITRQTLGFYRESERFQPVVFSELPGLMDDVIETYAGSLLRHNIAVRRRYPSCPGFAGCKERLLLNPGELRQVISILVSNSMDALSDNGALYIRTARTNDKTGPKIHLTIADTGTGIHASHLKRIFEPFFTTKETVGTGLGLWVTQELVLKHNGRIKVRSQQGKGTVFRISFPAAA